MGRGTLGEVRDGSCYPFAGPGRVMDPAKELGWVGGPSVICGTGRESPGRVGGLLERPDKARWTLKEVRDGSGDPR